MKVQQRLCAPAVYTLLQRKITCALPQSANVSLRLGLILLRSVQNTEVMHDIALSKHVYLVHLRFSKAHFGAEGVSRF